MPQLPSFLTGVADRLEPVFAKTTLVEHVADLGPRLRRVRLRGEALRGVKFVPGQQVEFRVSATEYRHYTPSLFDSEQGSCELLFHLHGHAPGSDWARALRSGDEVKLMGPGDPLRLLDAAEQHVMLGDETCLGLFECLQRASREPVHGAVEVDDGDDEWWPQLGLAHDPVARRAPRGAALTAWLDARPYWPERTAFYLVGHAQSILALRRVLQARGVARRWIRTKPYWADGKRGL